MVQVDRKEGIDYRPEVLRIFLQQKYLTLLNFASQECLELFDAADVYIFEGVHSQEVYQIAEPQKLHAFVSEPAPHLVVHVIGKLELLVGCLLGTWTITFL